MKILAGSVDDLLALFAAGVGGVQVAGGGDGGLALAGKLEEGEDPAATAARELEEETGYTAASLTKLTELLPTPAYSTWLPGSLLRWAESSATPMKYWSQLR